MKYSEFLKSELLPGYSLEYAMGLDEPENPVSKRFWCFRDGMLERFADMYPFEPEFQVSPIAITICPPNHDNPDDCIKIIDIIRSIRSFTNCYFVLEQRSEDPEKPHGFHLHGRFESTYTPAKSVQFIQQKMKSRGISFHKDHTFKAIRIKSDGWNAYLSGDKEQDKLKKVETDIKVCQRLSIAREFSWN